MEPPVNYCATKGARAVWASNVTELYAAVADLSVLCVRLRADYYDMSARELLLNRSIAFVATGLSAAVFDARLAGRVIHVGSAGVVWLEGCVLTGGHLSPNMEGFTDADSGGGVFNLGQLRMHNCTVTSNVASYGAGVANRGQLIMNWSSILRNKAGEMLKHTVQEGYGGGLYNQEGYVILVSCNVNSNYAATSGGGIHNQCGTVFVDASRIVGNNATSRGGGVMSYGSGLNLSFTNLSHNVAFRGGGIYTSSKVSCGTMNVIDLWLPAFELHSCFVEQNAARAPKIAGGGLYNRDCNGTFFNSMFRQNTATAGAGMQIYNGGEVTYVLPAPKGYHLDGVFVCGEQRCTDEMDKCCSRCSRQSCNFKLYINRHISITAQGAIDSVYPGVCNAGFYANSTKPLDQSQDCCAGVCPAGYFCPHSPTIDPIPVNDGYWSSPGAINATPCAQNSYANLTLPSSQRNGQAACVRCSVFSQTDNVAATSVAHCKCIQNYYRNDTATDVCYPCPVGAKCSHSSGTTTLTMRIRREYWRASLETSNVRSCPQRGTCVGDASLNSSLGDYCDSNRTRIDSVVPYCSHCKYHPSEYLDRDSSTCQPCSGPQHLLLAYLGSFCFLVVVLLSSRRSAPLSWARWVASLRNMICLIEFHASPIAKGKQVIGFYQIVTHLRQVNMTASQLTLSERFAGSECCVWPCNRAIVHVAGVWCCASNKLRGGSAPFRPLQLEYICVAWAACPMFRPTHLHVDAARACSVSARIHSSGRRVVLVEQYAREIAAICAVAHVPRVLARIFACLPGGRT